MTLSLPPRFNVLAALGRAIAAGSPTAEKINCVRELVTPRDYAWNCRWWPTPIQHAELEQQVQAEVGLLLAQPGQRLSSAQSSLFEAYGYSLWVQQMQAEAGAHAQTFSWSRVLFIMAFLQLGVAWGVALTAGPLLRTVPVFLMLGVTFYVLAHWRRFPTMQRGRGKAAQPVPAQAAPDVTLTLPPSTPDMAQLLHQELSEWHWAAAQGGHHRWSYETALARDTVLPETVKLHQQRGAPDDDPSFLAALDLIRQTALRDAAPSLKVQRAWEEHLLFLQGRAQRQDLVV